MQDNEKTMAALTHVTAFSGYLTGGIGFIVGPLILWIIKKEESRFIDYHGRSCLNFHISLLIYGIISGFLMLVLVGFLLALAVVVAQIVFTIIAAIKASNGEYYRYPLSITFLALPPESQQPEIVEGEPTS